MCETAGFARRAAARLGHACGVSVLSYICWREFYLRVLRPKQLQESKSDSGSYNHALRLTTSYYLDVPAHKGFLILADPTLLNRTTPMWFNINVRPKSKDSMQHFCHYLKKVDFDKLYKNDQETELSDEQAFLRSFPYFFSYWTLFLGAPFPWTSKVLICQKVLNPQFYQGSISSDDRYGSLNDVKANEADVSFVDQSLMREACGQTPGDTLHLDEHVVVRPLLGQESYKFFFRMKYMVEQGPYLRFEHTHLVICEQDGHDQDDVAGISPSQASTERGGPKSVQEHCRVEDTILFTVLGEPILDYVTAFFLKKILLCRFNSMIADYGGAFINEQVFNVF